MVLDDLRKTIEATLEILTSTAKDLADAFRQPGAAKEQLGTRAADLMEWSQQNSDRMSDFVRREIAPRMKTVGVATQSEVDALKKRVRDLERAAGMTASGKKTSARSRTRKTTASRSSAAKGPGA
jgi:polyhydroxyalkanoate synthesis regulator phasin